ncbi:MAG: hypothetical protein AB1500_10605 [Bacillota bacterium]
MKTDKTEGRRRRFNSLKVIICLGVLACIVFFLWSTVLRVEMELGMAPGSDAGLTAVVVGFVVLFLGGVFYGLWMLLIEHYIAFSLVRQLVTGINDAAEKGFDENTYAV